MGEKFKTLFSLVGIRSEVLPGISVAFFLVYFILFHFQPRILTSLGLQGMDATQSDTLLGIAAVLGSVVLWFISGAIWDKPVYRYALELNKRIRRHVRRPGGSWRVDENYVRVAGQWAYLYRALDSQGNTIDFMLSPKRDLVAAKHFLQLALWRSLVRPRVINVDGHPAYAHAIAELKEAGELGPRCRCRTAPYLNNIVEQDHRFIKKRIAASLGFRSVTGAVNTIGGYEAMHMIRKGQVRWLAKGDVVGQVRFINQTLGIAA